MIFQLPSDIFKIGGDEINKQLEKVEIHAHIEKNGEMEGSQNYIAAQWRKKCRHQKLHANKSFVHAYKIFTRIIQNRIKRTLDENQPHEQAGFREGFSTTDHIHVLNQLIEMANEYQSKICVGYIDYENTFDW